MKVLDGGGFRRFFFSVSNVHLATPPPLDDPLLLNPKGRLYPAAATNLLQSNAANDVPRAPQIVSKYES